VSRRPPPRDPILPGATLGVLGSGQLGRMFALAARAMGYRVHVLSPGADTPTGQVADHEHAAPYEHLAAVRAFARKVDVVTFEFENVPAATAETCAAEVPVRPAGEVLHVAQNRLREKAFLAGNGFPVAPFRRLGGAAELAGALAAVGAPAVLKSAGWGYDGKGQAKVASAAEAEAAWGGLAVGGGAPREAVLEAFVEFEREVSVVGARGLDGSFVHWGVLANDHADHVLDVTVAPAPVPDAVAARAVEIARGILEALGVVGVLCVEMFLTAGGELLVNELAPRPHNSGHLTIEAAATSQFEQQVRAVCGLPLGSTELVRPAAMANLLGDLWRGGEPAWPAALAVPGVSLHLYGKADPRPGRKMGHLTALGSSTDDARDRVLAARRALTAGR
jgi:5-(carboxyamino)imidazole ribonucleotide synthase